MFDAEILERVIEILEPARHVIYNLSSAFTNFSYLTLNIKKMGELVKATRKKNNLTFNKDYDISGELQKTSKNKEFLYYDFGMMDENRIVIFTTD